MRALRSNRRRRAAVLSELILAMFISSLIFTVLPGFYFTYVKIWSRESSRVESIAKATMVIQRMEKEVRNARGLSVSSDGRSLTIVLPKQRYDSSAGRLVNDVDQNGQLVDGDRVQYYVATNPDAPGTAFYRRVDRLNGTSTTPQLVAANIYPELNPLVSGTSSIQRVFVYNSTLRTVTVTATAAETRESVGSFAPTGQAPQCSRDHGALVRVATESRPEGEIRCSQCGPLVRPNAETVTHQIQLLARNK
jgi:type II secretory pathway component PulJ